MNLFVTLLLVTFGFTFDLSLSDDILWDEFISTYRNKTDNSLKTYNYDERKTIFKTNLEYVRSLNKKGGAQFSINQFSDLSFSEFTTTHSSKLSYSLEKSYVSPGAPNFPEATIPSFLSYCGSYSKNNEKDTNDYCTEGIDQGKCGSCYAVGISHLLQIQYAMKTNEKNCSYGISKRCCGGLPQDVLNNLRYFVSEKDYPYKDKQVGDECERRNCIADKTVILKHNGYTQFDECYNEDLEEQLQHYKSGVLQLTCANPNSRTTHVVVVVGYGKEDNESYLIVRNSWGDWGENGYFRVSFNDLCGIGGNDDYALPTSLFTTISTNNLSVETYGIDVIYNGATLSCVVIYAVIIILLI
ncbi:Cysteine protease [Entamoeba marina]